jgi:hypothetical protein
MPMLTLEQLVADFAAEGLRSAEGRGGPHGEAAAVALVMAELRSAHPERYLEFRTGVPYPNAPRQKCDLCIGNGAPWQWAVEVKLLRFLGDNGQPNDNMLMHILSPYPEHRSALTDCKKLVASGMAKRNAILIYGFEAEGWPLQPAIEAFEVLAATRVKIVGRATAEATPLMHPVPQHARVFGWEIA